MQPEMAVPVLTQLRDQIPTLTGGADSAEFVAWNHRTRSVLSRTLGETHAIAQAFITLRWYPSGPLFSDSHQIAFRGGLRKAQGLLAAAIQELEDFGGDADAVTDDGVDPELWEHVRQVVEMKEWGKVARESLIFTEDRIRRWAGRPQSEIGERLMVAVFGDTGDFRLGVTDPERQGWQLLAMGISKALRNANTHRIQKRADLKSYGTGVLGTCSLLLTEMRYEYGGRMRDESPVHPTAE
jgi:hypothetical protein